MNQRELQFPEWAKAFDKLICCADNEHVVYKQGPRGRSPMLSVVGKHRGTPPTGKMGLEKPTRLQAQTINPEVPRVLSLPILVSVQNSRHSAHPSTAVLTPRPV